MANDNWPEDAKRELIRLLTNGADVPGLDLDGVTHVATGRRYIAVDDLQEFLCQLADATLSDQKQEAFRGLRLWLYYVAKHQTTE